MSRDYYNFSYYEEFLSSTEAAVSMDHFSRLFDLRNNKRQSFTFGNKGLVYEVKFGGYKGIPETISKREVIDWTQHPLLMAIKDQLEFVTTETFTICVIQYYPNGSVGISKHKDKEMKPGTMICGISLGQTRELKMHPPSFLRRQPISTNLAPGSLYILKPPTNDYWMHSTEKDSSTQARISLTFRNY